MLRGLGRSSRYWLGRKNFSKKLSVITLDFRGIGRSTAPLPWLGGFKLMVEDLCSLKRHLEIDRWHILACL